MEASSGPFDRDGAVVARLRDCCVALPEVEERLSHGSPAWFVRGKKTFVMFLDDHHGCGILGLWCAAPPGAQAELVDTEPERFYVPPYVGHRGWLGVRLDRIEVDHVSAPGDLGRSMIWVWTGAPA